MEEIQSQSDNYRSSSSSASSPTAKVPSTNFFFLHKPGSLRKPISFEDSPDWEETDVEARAVDDGGLPNHVSDVPVTPSLSKINSESFNSPQLGDEGMMTKKIVGASIVWKDLTVKVKGKRKYADKIVKSSSGYALPGTITVIMGPSKSGKSTLLRAIAGRLCGSSKMYGEVFFNGLKMAIPYGSYGYVERETTLIGSLTVREFLGYATLLQLRSSSHQKKNAVEDAIHAMSLEDYADKLIGGRCNMKGLSNGERRRVSIARELVTSPHILFIDEPLYQLDSVSALLMMVTLKRLANTGCTLVFTIYQSSTEVFGLFDRICLLSNGNTLFFGETLACLQHFSNAGFPCPIMQSPSDHFLRAINTEFDRIISMCRNWQDDRTDFSAVNMDTAVAIRTLEATYRSSGDAAVVESMMAKVIEKGGQIMKSRGRVSIAARTLALTRRSLLIMSREWKYFWLYLILNMFLSFCIGTLFSRVGHSLMSVKKRITAIFVFVSFTSLMSITGVPAHINEIKVYACEESNRHSDAFVFLFSHLLSSIPYIALISLASALIFYFLVGMHNELHHLIYFILNIFACSMVDEGLLLIVASILQQPFESIVTLTTIHIIMMLSAGYFRIQSDLPLVAWKYPLSLVAFHTYSIKGLIQNEFLGESFAAGGQTISGFDAVHADYNISWELHSNSKWANLLVLFLMAFGYRLLTFAFLLLRPTSATKLSTSL